MIERQLDELNQALQEQLRNLQGRYRTATPDARVSLARDMERISQYLMKTAQVGQFVTEIGDIPLDYERETQNDHPLVDQEIAQWEDTHEPNYVDPAFFNSSLQRGLSSYNKSEITRVDLGQVLVALGEKTSQADLAKQSELSPSYISLVTAGKRELTVATAVKIIMGGYQINPRTSEPAHTFLNKLAHLEAPNGFRTRR